MCPELTKQNRIKNHYPCIVLVDERGGSKKWRTFLNGSKGITQLCAITLL